METRVVNEEILDQPEYLQPPQRTNGQALELRKPNVPVSLNDLAARKGEAVEIVKEEGARDIYLSFTHALLVPPAIERLEKLPVKEIVTTNTIPIPPEKRLPNMTVLSVATLLGEVILRAHEGRSVGEMFNE